MNKIKLQKVLRVLQMISTSSVVVIAIGALVLNGFEDSFEGTFAIVYSIILGCVSIAVIVITLTKVKVENSIIEELDKAIYDKATDIQDMLNIK